MLKSMCERVGIFGKNNHSLRATGATRLFEANVPEKLIQERTGHRSTSALRQYEHTSVQQHQSVSSIIASVQPFSSKLQRIGPQYGAPPINPQLPTLMGECNLSNFTLNVNFNY